MRHGKKIFDKGKKVSHKTKEKLDERNVDFTFHGR
jgi:hypothetical protein